jgi:hypothetical protein
VKLDPGATIQGYLTFQIYDDATLLAVQFSMDAGFGETAEWKLT